MRELRCQASTDAQTTITLSWCVVCLSWHYRLQSVRRSEPSSSTWLTVESGAWSLPDDEYTDDRLLTIIRGAAGGAWEQALEVDRMREPRLF